MQAHRARADQGSQASCPLLLAMTLTFADFGVLDFAA